MEPLCSPSIIDQGGLDTLGGSDGKGTCNYTCAHASKEIAERGHGSCVWICEGFLDGVESEEANAILRYRTLIPDKRTSV